MVSSGSIISGLFPRLVVAAEADLSNVIDASWLIVVLVLLSVIVSSVAMVIPSGAVALGTAVFSIAKPASIWA